MTNRAFLLGMSLAFLSSMANATLADVCELSNKPVNSTEVSQEDIQSYQAKLKRECDLSSQYRKLNDELQSKYSVSLTDIAEYQAIRFVQRSWLERAASEQKPIEIIYQMHKSDYDLPRSSQSAVIWDDWAMGVKQLEPMIENFKAGQKFDLATLKKIHRGLFPFYPTVSEHGDFAHEPHPGVLKPTAWGVEANYWWTLDTQNEIDEAQRIVDAERNFYSKMGLLTPTPKGYPDYVTYTLDVRETVHADDPSKKVVGLFSGHGMTNRQNTELILDMVDQLMAQARQGQHMLWKGKLWTPAELAYFVQQAYVRVHPFYEGNGRTSRFLQELILQSFQLPHGASGDLMDIDALTQNGEYYQKAIQASFAELNKMNQCKDEYSQLGHRKSARSLNQDQISYSCRILSDRSQIWAQLVQKNEVDQADAYKAAMAELKQMNQQHEEDHRIELARRLKGSKPAAPTYTAPVADDSDDCSKLTGPEKTRCETFAEIKRKIRAK